MSKFEFLNRKIELEIAGEKFVLTYGDDLARRVQTCMSESVELIKEIKTGEKGDDDVTPLLHRSIDRILESDGACNRIFKGREPEVIEANDIIWYIIGEVRKKREELEVSPSYQARKAEKDGGVLDVATSAVVEMMKPNRAARRAASKKK